VLLAAAIACAAPAAAKSMGPSAWARVPCAIWGASFGSRSSHRRSYTSNALVADLSSRSPRSRCGIAAGIGNPAPFRTGARRSSSRGPATSALLGTNAR